jgi:predicted PurR-regulated permease PerM
LLRSKVHYGTTFPDYASNSEARSATLQSLLIAAIVITGLYVGREVLLPLALAILLSFVLTPALLFLRRLKVPRVAGVAIVAAVAFALIFGARLVGLATGDAACRRFTPLSARAR